VKQACDYWQDQPDCYLLGRIGESSTLSSLALEDSINLEVCAGSLLSFNHTVPRTSHRLKTRRVRSPDGAKSMSHFLSQVLQPCLHVIAFGSVLGIAYQHETLFQVETLSLLVGALFSDRIGSDRIGSYRGLHSRRHKSIHSHDLHADWYKT
jgi:hypothetical protein